MSMRRFVAYFVILSTCSTVAFASWGGQAATLDTVSAPMDAQVAIRTSVTTTSPAFQRLLSSKAVLSALVAAIRD